MEGTSGLGYADRIHKIVLWEWVLFHEGLIPDPPEMDKTWVRENWGDTWKS